MADTKHIAQKREQFIAEIGNRPLTAEQQRIYNAFAFPKSKAVRFAVDDIHGNTIRFSLSTNKIDDGVLHIFQRHYLTSTGKVSAYEIVCLCDVIRKGTLSMINGNMKYTLCKGGKTYTLIVFLKRTGTGQNVLKSFYSNKTYRK